MEGPPDWGLIDQSVVCPLCAYDLRHLKDARCPECGYSFVWDEMLDYSRRLHPYLYEHHPERELGSFVLTQVGSLRPFRFWKELHPVQAADLAVLVH